jgi:hypothetical protein
MFLVDIKGLYRINPWVIKRKPERDNLYYVLAFVPTGAANRFFILQQSEINEHIQGELTRLGRANDYPMTGISFKIAMAYEDAWAALPE